MHTFLRLGTVSLHRFEGDVRAALSPYAGSRAYFEPLGGNHGDRLILLGARHWMEPLGFHWVQEPSAAEVIVINGGGGLFVQPWCADLSELRRYTLGYRSTRIVVLPSSYHWGEYDLAACFSERRAETVLFARERASLVRLERAGLPEGVSIGLDHDMAFRLEGTELIERARSVPSGGYVLVVERFDEEHATGKRSRLKPLFRYGKHLPVALQEFAKKTLDRVRHARSSFRRTALDEAVGILPSLAGKPAVYNDVSNVSRNTFEEFVEIVAAADAVITTRMHAGILAAMLGKPTFLKGRDDGYRKLQSVYAYSLASLPHVHLLEI